MVLSFLLVGVLALLPALSRAFTNPVIWNDLADVEIRNINGVFYYSASTMHYSPGAPILRSYDLFNWEFIGHSVPSLDFGSNYDMANGTRAYVEGVWASFFNFNPHTNLWMWGGCIDFWHSYIYTAPAVTGPWTQHTQIYKCYYDAGMLIDDDGSMYVSFVQNNNIWVAQLTADATAEASSQEVFPQSDTYGYLEGTRMYKRNGYYYILADHPSTSEIVFKASSPFGPYTSKVLVDTVSPPLTAGPPHQGGIVDAGNDTWYYMAFVDSYPGGRIPILAPLTWGSDGFPSVDLVNGGWGSSYANPLAAHPVPSLTGTDTFSGTSLGPQWEWNHNPDTTKFSVNNGLTLKTATVTPDLYSARNTLTHRILGPSSTATIKLALGGMADGDRAGLALFRDHTGWVGVARDGGALAVRMVTDVDLSQTGWTTTNTGADGASPVALPKGAATIWLRVKADIAPASDQTAQFSYSTDGSKFTNIGGPFTMENSWNFFMGYRFGIFNYATVALGGSVKVSEFTLSA
ncbi:glycosyl hydrolase [Epithele typhae]|uniref:glycosyl hydrolase n=1 Tax=Epithele typhae TaxID=378194 RepID=UPI002007F73E|nr:glycosyl hydrolase [Epithele typhae]KAH9943141.1 glycosyl hydrolase [Epithele typhae]